AAHRAVAEDNVAQRARDLVAHSAAEAAAGRAEGEVRIFGIHRRFLAGRVVYVRSASLRATFAAVSAPVGTFPRNGFISFLRATTAPMLYVRTGRPPPLIHA